ncbi:MAG: family 16 glycosylhydrolase [Candidatus Marinimicrobia bacterium]|nr:family 16 glycosylhydrolase [Candidatus Neomarinimicrobiota bacterium]
MKTIALLILIHFTSFCFAKDYYGAELRTKISYTYGRFDVCLKASSASGQLSTFFLYHELGSEGTEEWNEIDIEILGRYDDNIQFNTITPGQKNHVCSQMVNFDPAADFHHYAIEWTPDYVAWFIDSTEVFRQTGPHIKTLTEDQKIMMNIWQPVYEDWVGEFDNRTLPQFAYYDWIQYSSYTPDSGNCGTNNNFTFKWKDDFDNWNKSRWAKASHTWNGNNSDFTPQNIVFQDGKMVLCLTDKVNPGYIDKNEPFIENARYINKDISVQFSEEISQKSAEKITAYNLSGEPGAILSANPDKNNRSVILDTENLDSDASYTIFASQIADLFNNRTMASSKKVIMPAKRKFPMFINVGGSQELQYNSDYKWKDNYYGYIGGAVYTVSGDIANTQEDKIYHSFINGIVEYKITVPPGKYDISMMLMEQYFNKANQRIFDIYIENEQVADSLDIYKETGKYSAYILQAYDILIEDGVMDIYFSGIKDMPVLNGLKIFQHSTEIQKNSHQLIDFQLDQNYPNPFNANTTIKFNTYTQGKYDLSIFNVLGEKVETLLHKNLNPGNYKVRLQSKLPTGVYYYKLGINSKSKNISKTKKMLLLK